MAAATVELHVTYAAFNQSSGNQTLTAKIISGLFPDTVQFFGRLRFFGDVNDLGRMRLHLKGEFIGGNTSIEVGVSGMFLQMLLIQFLDEIDFGSLKMRIDPFGWVQIDDRLVPCPEGCPLKCCRHKSCAPV